MELGEHERRRQRERRARQRGPHAAARAVGGEEGPAAGQDRGRGRWPPAGCGCERATTSSARRTLRSAGGCWRTGAPSQTGTLGEPLDVAPGQAREIALPYDRAEGAAGARAASSSISLTLRDATPWAPAGHEVAWEQLALPAHAGGRGHAVTRAGGRRRSGSRRPADASCSPAPTFEAIIEGGSLVVLPLERRGVAGRPARAEPLARADRQRRGRGEPELRVTAGARPASTA